MNLYTDLEVYLYPVSIIPNFLLFSIIIQSPIPTSKKYIFTVSSSLGYYLFF